MFTQCPKCETIFKLSADVLRTAGGQVRCGRCGEVFNALTRLAEQPGAFTLGESALEQETRADDILRSSTGQAAGIAASPDFEESEIVGPGIAHLEFQESSLDADSALGADAALDADAAFNADPTLSADATQNADPTLNANRTHNTDLLLDADPLLDDDAASLEFTLPPGELDRIFVEVKPSIPLRTALPRELLESARSTAPQASAAAEEPTPEDLLAGPRPSRGAVALWSITALLLLLVLAVQIAHENPQWLVAANTPYAKGLRALFATVGDPVPVPANLAAYELRQWGVSGDPDAGGALRVRASILNTASELEPYPLLRVTLADRFGTRIGARDFLPAEYLGKSPAKLLAPGERADAVLDILDPGKNAEGFELDVCVRGIKQKISCQSDLAGHPQ
jgi:predicted Zn finger-like uncharacterized protein